MSKEHVAGRVFIGTSGWNYKSWAGGVFYPAGLKPAEWLAHYVQHFNSVEINNSFYRLPERRVFESWHDQTPPEFIFTVKASRFITHMKKLIDVAEHAETFLTRACALKEKLGVVLFQLPPFWKFNCARLEAFCQYVSRQDAAPQARMALEVRHPSWFGERCFEVLRQHGVALALADWPGLKVTGPLSADFVFVRRHGPQGLYSSDYSDASLEQDAGQIRAWRAAGRDVYTYFNNDVQGFAVKNALRLKELVGVPS